MEDGPIGVNGMFGVINIWEPNIPQHGLDAGAVRSPPVRVIIGAFRAGVENHRRPRFIDGVDMGLDDHHFLRQLADALKCQ